MKLLEEHKNESPASTASHDIVNPPNLLSFMMTQWKPTKLKVTPLKNAALFAKRRSVLSQAFPKEMLVVSTGHEKVRANDTHFRFRPDTAFFYLTGCHEPDCVLVLMPKPEGGHTEILFVEPNPGRSDVTFFTDRNKGEFWVGPRLGVSESKTLYGIEQCQSVQDLEKALVEYMSAGKSFRWLPGVSRKLDTLMAKFSSQLAEKNKDFELFLSEQRLYKYSFEAGELKKACEITKKGFDEVIAVLKGAKSEREIEGVFNHRARVDGNDVGYLTIAASGHHACTLHWKHNDGKIKKGDLLLLDAGVETHSLYTADVTRTLPIKGKFSKPQKEVYELVLAAQLAAIKACKPGNDFLEPNREAMKVLATGLVKMGILKCTAEEALKNENQFYKRYSLHNVSHMLGLDVHDCAKARQENYKFGKLKEGIVLTVEPGLYFQKDDLTVPAKYRGIGVRLEDDVLITKKGHVNLSKNFPKTVKDVENWMAKVWKKSKSKR